MNQAGFHRIVTALGSVAGILLLVFSMGTAGAANVFLRDAGVGQVASFSQRDEVLSTRLDTSVEYSIAYTHWSPASANGTTIVYNHGMQSHRGWFYETAQALARQGYSVYAFDRIGSGESSDGLLRNRRVVSGVRGHIRDWMLFVDTLAKMVDIARHDHPGSRIVLWGNSYGAKVVTAYLLLHAENAAVDGALFTVPGFYTNEQTMPLPFSRVRLVISPRTTLFPVPMVEHDGDNGAGWFVSSGVWFDRIRADTLSLRQVTRDFYVQTNAMDNFVARKSHRLPAGLPVACLLVRGDRMMDNRRAVELVVRQAPGAVVKEYGEATHSDHFLLFSEQRNAAMRDILAFLAGLEDGSWNE